MTRRRFAGDADSVLIDTTGRPIPGGAATLWTAQSGGTQVTDIRAADGVTAIAGGLLYGTDSGLLPMFYGPDGVNELWVDGGRGRLLLEATDLASRLAAIEVVLANTAAGGTVVLAPTTYPVLATPIAGDKQAAGSLTLVAGTSGSQVIITGGATVYEGPATTYTATNLTNDAPVTFMARAYRVDATGNKLYGPWSPATTAVTPTAPPPDAGGTVTDVEETVTSGAAYFTFVGAGWAAGTGVGKSGGGDEYNNGADNTQFYTFNWVSLANGAIDAHAGMAGHHGQIAYSLDGGSETTVDLGTADGTRRDDQSAKVYTGISAGAHQLKGRLTATSGVGTGTTVAVDRVRVTNLSGTVTPPAGGGGGSTAVGALTRTGHFLYRNGVRFRMSGINHYMLTGCGAGNSALFNGSSGQMDTRTVGLFQALRPGTVIRVPLYRGYDLNRFDLILSAAAANGGHLLVPYLANFIDGGCGDGGQPYGTAWFTNNKWRISGGQVLSGYTYEAWLRLVTTRYQGDPSIGWIEIGNEAGGGDLAALKRCHDEMTTVIKTLDPTRLTGSGTHPAWAYGGATGYQSIHDVPNMDLLSSHPYDYTANTPNHVAVQVGVCKALNKPGYVGEYGMMGSPGGDPTQFINGNSANTSQPCLSFTARASGATNINRTYMNGYQGAGSSSLLSNFQDYRDYIAATMLWSYTFENSTSCQTNIATADTATRTAIHDFAPLT